MVRLLAALLLAAALVLGLMLALRGEAGRSSASRQIADPQPRAAESTDARAALERIAALESELASLRRIIDELRAGMRSPAAPLAVEVARGDEARDARWYLEQYVRSFDGGGRGSEYFRLAVQAYVLELVEPVADLVRRRGGPPALRAGASSILGDARLAGDDRAVGALVTTLAEDEPVALVAAALASLRVIALERHLAELTARVWRVLHAEERAELLRLVLDLAGERPNETLARLLRGAPDQTAELELIASLRALDLDGALECFQLASHRERATRLAAAYRTHEFRDARTLALVEEWAAREPDEAVRRVLVGAREQLSSVPAWSAEQATGPPDVPDDTRDSREAWAPAAADGGREWLELGYRPAMRAHGVRVHEVCTAGGIVRVTLIDEAGAAHVVWEGVDPLTKPGVLAIDFEVTSYRVRAVRLELDTARRPGWEEIDAVQLLGPDGAMWAASARASSSYNAGATMTLPLGIFDRLRLR